eukprot:CAMPEP_0114262768 /NCGR_PEP_ID=MMETSP0058-20121206/22030_1 /TAXON_ID=36894 /ORGANISM="Pyramimonas parkeae, CCMP726" /LENGTH=760 /DNA_ID=CAMNT_0001378759 /DNA_START=115 /DNA_END=2397 /DNA_ORIENTATION=-
MYGDVQGNVPATASTLTSLLEKEITCPICLEIYHDVFVTHCGHSFCYKCVTEHLRTQCVCPSCSAFLSMSNVVPNFALDKVIKATQQIPHDKNSDLVMQLMAGVKKGMPLETVTHMLEVLSKYKDELEAENSETQLEILLEFLTTSRSLKEKTLADKSQHLRHLESDISLVRARKDQLSAVQQVALTLNQPPPPPPPALAPSNHNPAAGASGTSPPGAPAGRSDARSQHSHPDGGPAAGGAGAGSHSNASSGSGNTSSLGGTASATSRARRWANWTVRRWVTHCGGGGGASAATSSGAAAALPKNPAEAAASGKQHNSPSSREDTVAAKSSAPASQSWTESGTSRKRPLEPPEGLPRLSQENQLQSMIKWKKQRAVLQLDDLQECYLSIRSQMENEARGKEAEALKDLIPADPPKRAWTGLNAFSRILAVYTQYSQLRQLAAIPPHSAYNPSNSMISSIEFDCNEELFVTAGVSKRIRIFDFNALLQHRVDAHQPKVELVARSKLSCLSWNKFIKSHIASSDYEGVVTLWDTATSQRLMELEEHQKRVWSVDYSHTNSSVLVSGSDDGKVKVWDSRKQQSVLNIDLKANVCCVKYNPMSEHHLAVGSADHHVHSYDLRQPSQPICIFSGHSKAVSYVKFMSGHELASASTDSTLRLWDVRGNRLLRTLRGHTNEKNFVGLSVTRDFIACGSETNQLFVYHKQVSKPMCTYYFHTGSERSEGGNENMDSSHFISAVCWKGNSSVMLAANSQGTIKALTLAS